MESVISSVGLAAASDAIHAALDARIGANWTTNLIIVLALLVAVFFSQPFAATLEKRAAAWATRRFLAHLQTGLTLGVGFLVACFLGLVLGWTDDQAFQVLLIGLAGYLLHAGAMAFVNSLEWVSRTKEVITQVQCTICKKVGSLVGEQEHSQEELRCELTHRCRGTMKAIKTPSAEAPAVKAPAQGVPE